MLYLSVLLACFLGLTIHVLTGLVSNYWIWPVALGAELSALAWSLREAFRNRVR